MHSQKNQLSAPYDVSCPARINCLYVSKNLLRQTGALEEGDNFRIVDTAVAIQICTSKISIEEIYIRSLSNHHDLTTSELYRTLPFSQSCFSQNRRLVATAIAFV